MEKLRRKLKIFWTEHSDPILFYTIVIVAIILIVQGLNAMAIKNNEQKNKISESNNNAENNTINIIKNKENTELINSFIDYCKNGQINKAYELLSENCKKNSYPTINDFNVKYYNKMFKQDYDIEVEYQDNNIYKVIFYESVLASGKLENRKSIIEYYKIEQEIVEDKIYINFNISENKEKKIWH